MSIFVLGAWGTTVDKTMIPAFVDLYPWGS